MPYVRRDATGRIVALTATAERDGDEQLAATHPEVAEFLRGGPPTAVSPHTNLSESDIGMARVVEDLVDALVDRGLLMFTDLPSPAQSKLLERRRLRQAAKGPMAPLMGNEDEVI